MKTLQCTKRRMTIPLWVRQMPHRSWQGRAETGWHRQLIPREENLCWLITEMNDMAQRIQDKRCPGRHPQKASSHRLCLHRSNGIRHQGHRRQQGRALFIQRSTSILNFLGNRSHSVLRITTACRGHCQMALILHQAHTVEAIPEAPAGKFHGSTPLMNLVALPASFRPEIVGGCGIRRLRNRS